MEIWDTCKWVVLPLTLLELTTYCRNCPKNYHPTYIGFLWSCSGSALSSGGRGGLVLGSYGLLDCWHVVWRALGPLLTGSFIFLLLGRQRRRLPGGRACKTDNTYNGVYRQLSPGQLPLNHPRTISPKTITTQINYPKKFPSRTITPRTSTIEGNCLRE